MNINFNNTFSDVNFVIYANIIEVLTLVLRRGRLQPPCDFFEQLFFFPKRLYSNLYWPYNAQICIEIWGCRMGSRQILWWNSAILIFPITKTFDTIYACNLECGLELAFPYLFCQQSRENRMFLRFLAKIDVCLFFWLWIFPKFRGSAYIMTP